jgi:hypothetical protein
VHYAIKYNISVLKYIAKALFVVGLVALVVWYVNSKILVKTTPRIQLLGTTNVTGILRQMDLDTATKTQLSLKNGQYQLTQLNKTSVGKLPYKASSAYIEESPTELSSLVGKCVTIKGRIDTTWLTEITKNKDFNVQDTYNGVVFTPKSITKNDFSACDWYSADKPTNFATSVPKGVLEATFSGTFSRMDTAIPDIDTYNYKFVFEEPYLLRNNSSGLPQKVNSMPVLPINTDVWVLIENKLGNKVQTKAYELWGYMESKYLMVTSVN